MKKEQKLEYIKSVRARIQDAPNHGGGGTSWWYPTQWTVAYNIKIYARSKDIDDIRAKMTPVQNKYYSDTTVYEFVNMIQMDSCNVLREVIKEVAEVESVEFAGRSGGWVEVKYKPVSDADADLSDYDKQMLNELYTEMVKIDEAEQRVSQIVKETVSAYIKYIQSNEYVTDIVEMLLDDEDIVKEKQRALDEYKALA